MSKRHGRHKYRDTPYVRLEESLDVTNAGDAKKRRMKTSPLWNKRSPEKSKALSTCLRRSTLINNAGGGESYVSPKTGGDSSFLTISSAELYSDHSDIKSEDFDKENKQPRRLKRNTFRIFSESGKASVAKWCKIRDSFVSARRFSLPLGLDNPYRSLKKENVKPHTVTPTNKKNPLECIKRTDSLHNKQRRWSLFSTGYTKLNNSDLSPGAFNLEDAAHSTFIRERDDQRADTRKAKTVQGSVQTTSLAKVKRRRRRGLCNIKKLCVRSSAGEVKVKILMELSNASKKHRSKLTARSGLLNRGYIKSPLRTVDATPILPKRPLSRRSLFSEESDVTGSTKYKQTERYRYDESKCNDSINVRKSNAAPSAEEKRVHLSPPAGERKEAQAITPPNTHELVVSMTQMNMRRPRKLHKRKNVSL